MISNKLLRPAFTAVLLGAFCISLSPLNASAASSKTSSDSGLFVSEYVETSPPVGFVRFCDKYKSECEVYSSASKLAFNKVGMNADRWNMLYQVNTYVNGKIKPITDQELYGEPERWTYPVAAGDCEDYLLLKKRLLQELGFSAQNLRITVVLDETDEGHAVLTVTTDEGDYILDNRRNDILLWSDTNYTFLKRQSAENPRRWLALLKNPTTGAKLAKSQNQ